MSITVEQFRHAIEDDVTEYGHEFNSEIESSYLPGHFYNAHPSNGYGWSMVSNMNFTLVVDSQVIHANLVDTTGGENEGANASCTWRVGDQYFRKTGYYQSHYGYDWDGDLEEVFPVEKTVVVYE